MAKHSLQIDRTRWPELPKFRTKIFFSPLSSQNLGLIANQKIGINRGDHNFTRFNSQISHVGFQKTTYFWSTVVPLDLLSENKSVQYK